MQGHKCNIKQTKQSKMMLTEQSSGQEQTRGKKKTYLVKTHGQLRNVLGDCLKESKEGARRASRGKAFPIGGSTTEMEETLPLIATCFSSAGQWRTEEDLVGWTILEEAGLRAPWPQVV